jgi:DNA-binding MarR family transcriptional regulator
MRWQDVTQRFDEEVGKRHGLSAAERHALSFLWAGPQTASAVAQEIRLTPAAVTALIDRLERRGFVERRADPRDRRKVMVAAGPAAHALTQAIYAPLGQAGGRMLAGFTEAELQAFARVLAASIAMQEQATAALVATGEVPPEVPPDLGAQPSGLPSLNSSPISA